MNQFSRTINLIGEEKLAFLKSRKILLVGIGGVGGIAFEMLVRAGIGQFTIVDGDAVELTNLNRQIIALHSTLGEFKGNAAKTRALDINPDVLVNTVNTRYNELSSSDIFNGDFDYCIDCFDSVKDKVHFIVSAKNREIPIISAMGAGNRLTADFIITDINKTVNDGLAKAVRQALRKTSVTSLKVVYSPSPVIYNGENISSISYAPNIMGCMIAAEVIKDLLCRK